MLQPDAFFYSSFAALFCEILLSINNARMAKQGQKISPIYGILPVIGFLTFHISWWMSAFHPWGAILGYSFGIVASVAFLFGSAFVSTGCLTLKNGELCIDKDNRIFQLVNRLPIKFDGKSLCSISWVAAVCLFVIPIIGTLLGAVCAAISLVICLYTWQNPIPYFLTLMEFNNWPKTEVRKNNKGWWISPTPYLIVAFYLTHFIILCAQSPSIVLKVVLGITVSIGILAGVFYGLSKLAGKMFQDFDSLPKESQEKLDYDVRRAYWKVEEASKAERGFYIFVVFWQVFRQKFCPKIKYCTRDEMGHSDCED